MIISKHFPESLNIIYRTALSALFVLTLMATVSRAAEVTLAWDPNSESSVIGYTLYYGTASGVYTDSRDVGDETQYTLSGLTEDTTYYFAVTAYTDEDESDYSNEISYQVPAAEEETVCQSDSDCSSDEVCDITDGSCVGCLDDSDCDDSLFCNGEERCIDRACTVPLSPCSDDEICDEITDTCYTEESYTDCGYDGDCDDGLYCNGEEQCIDGICTAGSAPCGTDQVCNEGLQTCDTNSDITVIRAPTINYKLCKPVFLPKRRTWLLLKADQMVDVTGEDYTVTIEGAGTEYTGVEFDPNRPIIQFGLYIWVPVWITRDATEGIWRVVITPSLSIPSDEYSEIIESTFSVLLLQNFFRS